MSFYIHRKRFLYTKKCIFPLLFSSFAALILASCSTPKNSYYFKTLPRDTSLTNTVNSVPETRIQKNDQLAIVVSSLNPAEDAMYNSASGSGGGAPGAVSTSSGFTVDKAGNIQVHRLGMIHVEGMTRRELKSKLETDLTPYLRDPVIIIRFLNHRVTVLGEIASPGVVNMPEERLSLLELLASSGDLSQVAKKDNLLIIREKENGRQFRRVNLEDHSIFTSEWYFVQPGDVVYVEPSDKKLKDEKRARLTQNISLAMSGISFALIILDRILR